MTVKNKRDLFRFNGTTPIVFNLDHVISMGLEGKKIMVNFHYTGTFIEFENEEAAKASYERLIDLWAGDLAVCPRGCLGVTDVVE